MAAPGMANPSQVHKIHLIVGALVAYFVFREAYDAGYRIVDLPLLGPALAYIDKPPFLSIGVIIAAASNALTWPSIFWDYVREKVDIGNLWVPTVALASSLFAIGFGLRAIDLGHRPTVAVLNFGGISTVSPGGGSGVVPGHSDAVATFFVSFPKDAEWDATTRGFHEDKDPGLNVDEDAKALLNRLAGALSQCTKLDPRHPTAIEVFGFASTSGPEGPKNKTLYEEINLKAAQIRAKRVAKIITDAGFVGNLSVKPDLYREMATALHFQDRILGEYAPVLSPLTLRTEVILKDAGACTK